MKGKEEMETRGISLCSVEASHIKFLFKVFKESRWDLEFINNLDEKQKADILFNQFCMEQGQLIQQYPNAECNIVLLNEEAIGRLYVNHGEKADRILEIGLLEEYRGLGIGRKIVTTVIENAKKAGKAVCLQVAWFNEGAYKFYERIGFVVIEENYVFREMQYKS